MSSLAILDAAAGPTLILAGLLAAGPCLAASSGRPRAVLFVGGYALLLISALAWWPNRIWGTTHHLLFLLSTAAVTAVSVMLARHTQQLEAFAVQSQGPLRTLAAVVASTDEAIIGKTLQGVITSWNPGAERMYGYTAAEAVGSHISLICGPAGDQDLPMLLAQVAAGRSIQEYETQRRRKDGTDIDVALTISPIHDARGVVVGAAAVARDITTRKEEQERRDTVQERTRQAQRMQSLGQLAGGVAHDFNNLLAMILNFTAFAAERSAADAAVQADLDKVRNAAERGAGLTRQLLLFSRGEQTSTDVLDANDSITEACAMLSRAISADITLVTTPYHEPVLINADSGQIQQALVNLAINARDAMPNGGTLRIEASPIDFDEHQPDFQPPLPSGRYACLTVSDTGTGMNDETLAHIFDPFFTTKAVGYGTGLGLATVYGIVTDGGGSLHVSSTLGAGTSLSLYLPLASGSGPTANSAPSTAVTPLGQNQTVLVVDDQPEICEMLTRILAAAGYRPLSATDGPQALKIMSEESCALLVTDTVMPGMSGRRLVELLRRLHPHLPILYMSGDGAGLHDVPSIPHEISSLAKPFTANDLLRQVHDLIGGR
ncbi:PAS domain S-box protein [Pilimelia terevasa]|nr:PAS domain S-box protein [Pilimelia terevasa]